MPAPLVTIITPTYNRADLLEETILSVLSQDYPNLEYIVLDDGSKDDTVALLERYNGQIRWERHDNMGETRTVNKGLAMATGEIIGVVNSDDPLYPGAVRQIVEKMLEDPELVVVYPHWNYINEKGVEVQPMTPPAYDYLEMVRRHHCMPGPGTFFRRRVVEALGGRDVGFKYVADFEFWLRAGLVGPFAVLPKPLATFRIHPGSASVSLQGQIMAAEHVRLIQHVYADLALPPEVVAKKREAFCSAYYTAAGACGPRMTWRKRLYLLQSWLWAPHLYMTEYRDRLPELVQAWLPASPGRPLSRAGGLVKARLKRLLGY